MTAPDLAKFYARKWEEKYGSRLHVSFGKDGAIFKRLLGTYSAQELQDYVEHYLGGFVSDFSTRAGHSIGAFAGQLPAVVASFQEASKKREIPESASSDWERLEAARRDK